MRNRSILPLLLAGLVVLALFAFGGNGFLGQLTESTTPEVAATAEPAPGAASGTPPAPAPPPPAPAPPPPAPENPSGLPEVRESALPAEGRRILNLIRAGGPYRYSQDDQTFGNFERILPRRDRGYYREYTVPTPGETDRGARRIVAFKFIAEGS